MEEQAPQDPGARKDRRTTHGHTGLTALRLVPLAAGLTFALMLARGRADDNEETIRTRLGVYREETFPLPSHGR